MKPKPRRAFFQTVFIACSPVLLSSAASAQNFFWNAPVNGQGKRDGVWSTNIPRWALTPNGVPALAWNPSGIANFIKNEDGTVAVTGTVLVNRINAGTGGAYTITGSRLQFVGINPTIDVADAGALAVHSGLAFYNLTLTKTGTGTLSLGASSNLITSMVIQNGSVVLSRDSLIHSTVLQNAGTLTVNGANSISTYNQSTGTLAGSWTLIATDGATLSGGTVSGKLAAKTTISGDVLVSGSIGGGALTISAGTLTLTGTSTNHQIGVAAGASLVNQNGGMNGNQASLDNSGMLQINANDSIYTYVQTSGSILSGAATLTAIKAAFLDGGAVSGNLASPMTRIQGNVLVSGTIGGGDLAIERRALLTLSGVSTHPDIDILEYGSLLDSSGGLDPAASVTNAGTLTVNFDDSIHNYTQFPNSRIGVNITAGTLEGSGTLTVTGLATLKGGTVSGNLMGNVDVHGGVLVSGIIGGDTLTVEGGGRMRLAGSSSHATILNALGSIENVNGGFADWAEVNNAGTLTLRANDTIRHYIQSGRPAGLLDGEGTLTVTGEAILEGGTVAAGLFGNMTRVQGNVLVSGTIGGGDLRVESGSLSLTGTAASNTVIEAGASMFASGTVEGDLTNHGTLGLDFSGDRTLEITGNLVTDGIVTLSLTDASDFDQIQVGGRASLGGSLFVSNYGTGLAAGEVAQIIDAASYEGAFEGFSPFGFENGVLFDSSTGRLIGMAGGAAGSAEHYQNLNTAQTQVYFSLFEDAVETGSQNVTEADGSVVFTNGPSDGDARLVRALNLATFNHPGLVDPAVINRLSPEVHRGMADYTEQALRSHVRQAVDASPISTNGKTRVSATLHTSMEGVESSETDAGYDIQMTAVTTAVRHDIDARTQIGGLLGLDDGSIDGKLIDTDAHGVAIGVFGLHRLGASGKTTLTASLAYGGYEFDAERRSFEGTADADDIDSHAIEFAIGLRTVAFEKSGFKLSPGATLRYLGGDVDGFVEGGPGVPLKVEEQDIDSVLLDLAVDVEYKLREHITLAGTIGYVTDFRDSAESMESSFAATGALGRSFLVSAPGIDNDAVVLGLGAFYDLNDATRAGLTYRSEFRPDSQDAHVFGIGVSCGF